MASENGRFLIYPPRFPMQMERFREVGRAVVRIAEKLGAEVEISERRDVLSVWVYYKNDGEEEVPVYSDWNKKDWGEEEIYHSIRSVVYALSFHPRYQVLQTIRS